MATTQLTQQPTSDNIEVFAALCGGHLDGHMVKLVLDYKEKDTLTLPAFIAKSNNKSLIDMDTKEPLRFFLSLPIVGNSEDGALKPFSGKNPEHTLNYQFDGRCKLLKEKRMIRFFKYTGKETKETV